MRAQALQLAVAADVHADPGVAQRLQRFGDGDVPVVPVGAGLAADGAGLQRLAREEAQQALVLPDVVARVPPVLAGEAAEADVERRGVAHVGLPPQLDHVAPQRGHRQVVLDVAATVDDHREVVLQRAAAFLDRHHPELARGLVDLLALVAARLVVALHREHAVGAQPAQVGAGVVDRVHHGLEVAVGAVKDGAGREHARADHAAGLDQLGLGEHRLGVGGRVEHGGDAEGEVGAVAPVGLRDHATEEVRRMGVHVDVARQHGLAAGIDDARARGDRHLAGLADGHDAVAA